MWIEKALEATYHIIIIVVRSTLSLLLLLLLLLLAAAVDVYIHIACCLESAKKKTFFFKMCRFYTHALATHTCVCLEWEKFFFFQIQTQSINFYVQKIIPISFMLHTHTCCALYAYVYKTQPTSFSLIFVPRRRWSFFFLLENENFFLFFLHGRWHSVHTESKKTVFPHSFQSVV